MARARSRLPGAPASAPIQGRADRVGATTALTPTTIRPQAMSRASGREVSASMTDKVKARGPGGELVPGTAGAGSEPV